MITIKDKVRSGLDDRTGVVTEIHNGYYFVDMDDGDTNIFLESEIYLDVEDLSGKEV